MKNAGMKDSRHKNVYYIALSHLGLKFLHAEWKELAGKRKLDVTDIDCLTLGMEDSSSHCGQIGLSHLR